MADENSKAVKANEVRRLVDGNWVGVTGKGVIIGIIDSGIQYKSKAFQDKEGNSRLLYIYDQSLNRTGNPHADGATELNEPVDFAREAVSINTGLEYDRDKITAAIRRQSNLAHKDITVM